MKNQNPETIHFTSIFGKQDPAPLSGRDLLIIPRQTPPMCAISAWPDTMGKMIDLVQKSGVDLPPNPGKSARSKQNCVAHCYAPGRWLVEHPENELVDVMPEYGVLANLDHARSSFVFEGSDAVELAQKLAPIDFGLDRHGPMSFVQSGSDHGTSFGLWRETETRFIVYVERSYGRDFWHTLEAESAEFRA